MSSSKYPEYIEVDDTRYKLNTDFRVALRCFEIVEDENIDDYERALAVCYLLIGEIPIDKIDKILPLLVRFLQCDESKEDDGQLKDMDLIYDDKFITASFMSDYQIDLSTIDHMHWWQYIVLVNGLTNDCILNRVRDIRTCDISDYKGKARQRLSKAKQLLALPERKQRMSAEEKEAWDKFEALFNSQKKGE